MCQLAYWGERIGVFAPPAKLNCTDLVGPPTRRLSPGMLPSSRFGGPRSTKAMIHVTWHLTTIAFVTVGFALLLSGSVLHGDTARGIALVEECGLGALAAVGNRVQHTRGAHEFEDFLADAVHVHGERHAAEAHQRYA